MAGMVVRRRAPGVCGVCDVLTAAAPSKGWAPVCSTADNGGVAVMAMELGKRTLLLLFAKTAGDCGWAD